MEELGLNVLAAPNSLKGTTYLKNSPQARAEDLMWAFENKQIKGIIANIGGNDSERILPFISSHTIHDHPKILCGYSDILSLHLYCHQIGLITYYGDHLLTTIAEAQAWHSYSRYWFNKVFFDDAPIGEIAPSDDWSYDSNNHIDPTYRKNYIQNDGYQRVQGKGVVHGELFGGHGGMMEYQKDSPIHIQKQDFQNKIFFFEDIPQVCDVAYMGSFFDWLGQNGYLQVMRGVIIGKMQAPFSFDPFAERIREIVSGKYGLRELPILYGMNFGHANPICVLPYGVMAELDMDHLRFSIRESGVTA